MNNQAWLLMIQNLLWIPNDDGWWWLIGCVYIYIYICMASRNRWRMDTYIHTHTHIYIYIHTHYWKTVGKPRIKSVPWLGMVYTLYIEIMKTVGWWLWHVVNPTASSSWKKLILNQQKYSDCLGIWMDLMGFSFSDQTRLAGSCPLN